LSRSCKAFSCSFLKFLKYLYLSGLFFSSKIVFLIASFLILSLDLNASSILSIISFSLSDAYFTLLLAPLWEASDATIFFFWLGLLLEVFDSLLPLLFLLDWEDSY
jgi:hypothetical protein